MPSFHISLHNNMTSEWKKMKKYHFLAKKRGFFSKSRIPYFRDEISTKSCKSFLSSFSNTAKQKQSYILNSLVASIFFKTLDIGISGQFYELIIF